MGKRSSYEIDKDRLKKALAIRKLNIYEAAERIFRNKKYFYQLINNNEKCVVSTGTLRTMEEILGITYDEIKPLPAVSESAETAKAPVTEPSGVDYPTLERYVHKAVAEAIENRLPKLLADMFTSPTNEFQKVLGRAVYVGTKKAMVEALNGKDEQ